MALCRALCHRTTSVNVLNERYHAPAKHALFPFLSPEYMSARKVLFRRINFTLLVNVVIIRVTNGT